MKRSSQRLGRRAVILGLLVVAVFLGLWAILPDSGGQLEMGVIPPVRFPAPDWPERAPVEIAAEHPDLLEKCWASVRRAASSDGRGEGVTRIGKLKLTTGQIFITDLNFVADNAPLRRSVPPGEYPVYQLQGPSHSLGAAVVFREQATPTDWLVAGALDEPTGELRKGGKGLWGVSLDSGAIIVDGVACEQRRSFQASKLFSPDAPPLLLDEQTGLNIVAMNLGGVGVHPCYWGLDERGEPVVLLIGYACAPGS